VSGKRPPRLTLEEAARAGTRIRELRRQRGWGQRELGAKAGVVQSTVCWAERGNPAAGRAALALIAAALGLTEAELLGGCPRCGGSPRPWTRCLACGVAGATA